MASVCVCECVKTVEMGVQVWEKRSKSAASSRNTLALFGGIGKKEGDGR